MQRFPETPAPTPRFAESTPPGAGGATPPEAATRIPFDPAAISPRAHPGARTPQPFAAVSPSLPQLFGSLRTRTPTGTPRLDALPPPVDEPLDVPLKPIPEPRFGPADSGPTVRPPINPSAPIPQPALALPTPSGILPDPMDALRLQPAAVGPAPGVVEVRARPAALWQRITAFVVDGGLVAGVLALYLSVAAALVRPAGAPDTQLTGLDATMARIHQLHSVLVPCAALAFVLGVAYTAVFALLWNGRTPGRRLLGIRLVDQSGLAPAPGRAIARAALAVVSFVPFLAGFWLALFDRRGQTLHDKLTQTFVVRPS